MEPATRIVRLARGDDPENASGVSEYDLFEIRRRLTGNPLEVLHFRLCAWSLVWYRYGDSNPGPVAENHVS